MDFDFIMYIRQSALILVPVLIFLGIFLKQTPYIPTWSHAWIQLSFGVIACLLYYGFEIQSVVQGILVTGTAVISRDLIENTMSGINLIKNNRNDDK